MLEALFEGATGIFFAGRVYKSLVMLLRAMDVGRCRFREVAFYAWFSSFFGWAVGSGSSRPIESSPEGGATDA